MWKSFDLKLALTSAAITMLFLPYFRVGEGFGARWLRCVQLGAAIVGRGVEYNLEPDKSVGVFAVGCRVGLLGSGGASSVRVDVFQSRARRNH